MAMGINCEPTTASEINISPHANFRLYGGISISNVLCFLGSYLANNYPLVGLTVWKGMSVGHERDRKSVRFLRVASANVG